MKNYLIQKQMELRKRRLFQLSIFFIISSLGVTLFLFSELGMFDSIPAIADTKPDPAPTAQTNQSQRKSVTGNLDQRERELADKETVLNTQAERYEKSIKEFKERYENTIKETKQKYEKTIQDLKKQNAVLESQLEKKHETADKAAKVELFRQVYEKMEPKKAAQVFDQLDVSLAVQILSTMKPKIAAEIMDKMSPDRTRTVTEKFLGKKTLAKNTEEVSGQ